MGSCTDTAHRAGKAGGRGNGTPLVDSDRGRNVTQLQRNGVYSSATPSRSSTLSISASLAGRGCWALGLVAVDRRSAFFLRITSVARGRHLCSVNGRNLPQVREGKHTLQGVREQTPVQGKLHNGQVSENTRRRTLLSKPTFSPPRRGERQSHLDPLPALLAQHFPRPLLVLRHLFPTYEEDKKNVNISQGPVQ